MLIIQDNLHIKGLLLGRHIIVTTNSEIQSWFYVYQKQRFLIFTVFTFLRTLILMLEL